MSNAFWGLLLLGTAAGADDFGVHLDEATVDYARFQDGARIPELTYTDVPKERLDVGLNMSFLRWGYLNNTIHSLTSTAQFRLISWEYQVGVHLGDVADVYAEHRSEHLLDEQGPSRFPTQNAVGIKIYLYRREH